MLEINFLPKFIKKFNLLESTLQNEVLKSIELLKDRRNHSSLKVHKLHGPLKGSYSFSVNYKIRIIFQYISKKEAVLLTVGDHQIYK